ncbi:MAG: bifunctional isocitrate dehydrogenase kinase/phosphatase, partial [Acidobacteria bacterium]|nr:bifunctional isocitrate dehydrogenase kinase/phosphatase [Acidobacteriota bacterium]
GYNKHGKTELYCNLVAEVERTREQFIVAPGQRGLVMAVFTLPSYEWVYKVIKDSFPSSKPLTRREIMDRYRLVLHHDRVGRLVDYQEFEDLALPRERFDDHLLEELVAVAGKTVQVETERVVVRHAYVGRRVYPLDLFLRERSEEEAEEAVIDWGQCLRDLAAANIFAGDTLTKNFGVTRHGRVVFYDYDELRPLTECTFRRIPPARDDFDELADQPWFSIAESDVFPEELERFMGLSGHLRDVFIEHHGELFDAAWWQDLQTRLQQGELVDFFPYNRSDGRRSH